MQIASAATWDINGAPQNVAALSDANPGAGGSIINSNSGITAILTLSPSGGSTTYSGVIGAPSGSSGALGTIGLTMNGPGVQVLNAANTYTGPTTVTAGTLAVNGSLAAASNVSVGAVGTLAGSGLVGGNTTLAGSGVINLSGGTLGGTLVASGGSWNGTGTVAGAVTASGGLFTVGSGANLIANGGFTVSGGSLAGWGTITGANAVNLNAGSFLFPGGPGLASSTGTLSLPGLVTSGGATVGFTLSASTSGGNDLVQVNGPLTLNGTTTIAVNRINGVLASGDYPLFDYTGSLTYSSSATLSSLSPGALTARQQAFFDYGTSTPGVVMLDIVGTPGNLTWAGGTTGGSSGNFTNTWNQSALTNTVWNGGVDYFAYGDNVTFDATSSNNAVTLSGTLNPLTVTVTGSNNYTFNGPGKITGQGSLTVQGPGTLTVANSGGNDYTFGTFVNGGVLALGINNGLPIAGTLTLGSGAPSGSGTFDMAGFNQQLAGIAVGSGATAANQVIGNSAVSTTSTLTFSGSGSSSTFGGTIQDGGAPSGSGNGGQVALTVAAGLLNLSGSNTYSGPTNVSGGTLQLGSATALYSGAATGNATVNGTLDLNGNNAGIGGLTGTGSVTSSASGSMALTVGVDNATTTFSGTLAGGSGTVALVKSGSGTLTLAGTNSYTGGTIVNAGMLTASSNQQVPAGTVTVNAGGTINFAMANETNRTLSGRNFTIAGSGSSGQGALVATVSTTTASADIQVGNVALTANATIGVFGGQGTTVNSGIHFNEPGGAAGTLSLNGCTLTIIGSSTAQAEAYPGWLAATTGNGNIVVNSGNFLLNGAQPWAGGSIAVNSGATLAGYGGSAAAPLVINGGTLATANGTFALSGSVSLSGNATLTNSYMGGSATGAGTTLSGDISGSGGLTIAGGTNILSGSDTYSGPTVINAGTLQIGNGGSGETLNGTSGVANNGTLAFNHADALSIGASISGAGSVTKTGSGVLTLGSANAYSGNTTISGGQIVLGHPLAAQNSTMVVAVNNGLAFAGGVTAPSIGGLSGNGNVSLQDAAASPVTLSVGSNNASTAYTGVLSGSGGLVKTGTGTLTISANSTYSGTTVVNAGTLVLSGGVANFGGNGVGWTMNGTASATGNVLTLTTNGGGQAGSAFYDTKLPTGQFTASFTYTAGGNKAADGTTFVLQNAAAGPSALGGAGGSLGYSGITPSAAVQFNLYTGAAGGMGSAFGTGGVVATETSTSPVSLGSGDPIQVTLAYNGSSNLVETLSDTTNGATYSTAYNVNLASIVGGGSAYIGFTGATGGAFSTQTVSNFSFSSTASNLLPAATALQVTAGAAVDLNGSNQTVGSLSGAGTVTNSNGYFASTLGVGADGTSQTFSGLLTAATPANLALTKIGGGVLALTGANTYAGGTTVSGGVLQLGNSAALGSGGLTANNGTVDLAGFSVTVASLNGAAGTITNSGGSVAQLTVTQNGATTFSGTLQDGASPTSLVLTGTGALVLNGANTFSGRVVVNTASDAGQIVVANPLALQNANLADCNDNAIGFAANVTTATLGGILSASQSQSLTNAGGGAVTLAVGNNNANSAFSGNFTGLGGLDKVGTGSLTLRGTSSNTGANVLNAGTLVLAGGGALANLALNGGTLAGAVSGGTVNGLVQAGSGPHTIAPGAGVAGGQYGTLNLLGGLNTTASTTLSFNLNQSTPTNGIYVGDLINMNGSTLTVLGGSIAFVGAGPTALGDYRLIANLGGSSTNPTGFSLPVAPGGSNDAYTLSTSVDPGNLDLVVASAATFLGSATWAGTSGSAVWSNSGNWADNTSHLPGVPGTTLSRMADTATFNGTDSAPTITLDVSPSLAALSFSTTNYTLSGSGTLTMNGGTAGSVINVLGGTQSIASAVRIAGGNLAVNAVSNSLLALSGSVADDGNQRSLTLTGDGSGQLVLGGVANNTYSGGTYVDQGTLIANGTDAVPDGGAGDRRRRDVHLRSYGDRFTDGGNLVASGIGYGCARAGAGNAGAVDRSRNRCGGSSLALAKELRQSTTNDLSRCRGRLSRAWICQGSRSFS